MISRILVFHTDYEEELGESIIEENIKKYREESIKRRRQKNHPPGIDIHAGKYRIRFINNRTNKRQVIGRFSSQQMAKNHIIDLIKKGSVVHDGKKWIYIDNI